MVKVSVVIPVYNVEKFLGECLDSIVNQSLEDIEIICINDGSTDNSLNILNDYAKKDNRIIISSQKNGGHAVATNKGMKMAKGKYLYLMDSDDILELTALEETYKYAEQKNADVVLFQSMNYDNDENKYYKSELYSMDSVADFIGDSVVNFEDLGELIFKIPVTPWSKLYNNSFIKKINVKFPEGLIFDDNVFFWDILFNAERIVFLKKYLFTRRWYNYSSTTNGDYRFIDSIAISNLILERFDKYGQLEKFKSILYNRKIHITHVRFQKIKEEFKQDYFKKLHEDFVSIVSNGLYDDYINVLNKRNRNIFNSCLRSDTYTRFLINFKYNNYDKSNEFIMELNDKYVTLDDCKNKIFDTEKEILNVLDINYDLENSNKSLTNKLNELNKKDSKNNNIISYLETENTNLKKEILNVQDSNKKLKDKINLFENSKSWKVTKPLRSIFNFFK